MSGSGTFQIKATQMTLTGRVGAKKSDCVVNPNTMGPDFT